MRFFLVLALVASAIALPHHGEDHSHEDHSNEDHSEESSTMMSKALVQETTMMSKSLVEETTPMMKKSLVEEVTPMMKKSLVEEVTPMMKKSLVEEVTPMMKKSLVEEVTPMMKKSLVEEVTPMMKKALVETRATKTLEEQKQKTSSVNDGGRLLTLPVAEKCANRPKHFQLNGHWYFLSSNVTEHKDEKNDWLDSRNLCRTYCMDSVSIETEEENDMIFNLVKKERLPYIWTSGRLCNFKGCETREDLKPLEVLGWFWSGSGVKVAPTNKAPPGWEKQPWSATGHFKRAQPDNAEFEINETTEACLAVLNNVYKDGMAWHDIGCYHTKAVLCEDSDQLLKYVAATNRNVVL